LEHGRGLRVGGVRERKAQHDVVARGRLQVALGRYVECLHWLHESRALAVATDSPVCRKGQIGASRYNYDELVMV